jgi:hypothetical protein
LTEHKTSKRGRRGFSLVEAMLAGTILIIGLTGITAMMVNAAQNVRNGTQSVAASQFATQVLKELQTNGWNTLQATAAGAGDAGVVGLDGGLFFDNSGRVYGVTYVVRDLGPTMILGTTPWPAYEIVAEVTYRDGIGRTKTNQYTAVIQEPPGVE